MACWSASFLCIIVLGISRHAAATVKSAATESTSTGCGVDAGTSCADDGSTSWRDISGLTYSGSTGKFTGTLKANQCPPTAAIAGRTTLSSTCVSFDFPMGGASEWNNPPYGANLRGTTGFTFGLNYVYGPMDAGFGTSSNTGVGCSLLTRDAPEVCSVSGVSCCPPGTTAAECQDKIKYECEAGGGVLSSKMFLDDCGFHTPDKYHCHAAPRCEYNQANPDSHSPIVALSLDGYGMYGIYETASSLPDLDACNGHTGPVPANSDLGITAGDVYHYHFTPYAPYTMGCYGPVSSLDACKALYPECSSGSEMTWNARDGSGADYTVTRVLDCPCFFHMSLTADERAAYISKYGFYYNDVMSMVNEKGYNTIGSTVAANGYVTNGASSPTPSTPVPSTPTETPAPPTPASPTAAPTAATGTPAPPTAASPTAATATPTGTPAPPTAASPTAAPATPTPAPPTPASPTSAPVTADDAPTYRVRLFMIVCLAVVGLQAEASA